MTSIAQWKSCREAGPAVKPAISGSTSTPTPKPGFLDLPPEIRNKIYGLVIPLSRVLILGTHPQREREQYKKTHPGQNAPKCRYRLRPVILSGDDTQDLAAAAAFLRVCRAVRSEITSLLYSSTTFCFTAIKPINKFLNIIPGDAKQAIAKIEIAYLAYGEPLWTKDDFWKVKSDWKWGMVCSRIENELPALKSMTLGLNISDWPLCLTRHAGCFWPLEIMKGSGLERVRVHLTHPRFHPDHCATVARDLEDMMMTVEGRELRGVEDAVEAVHQMEELEAQKSQRPIRRAKRVLIIKDIPQAHRPSRKTYHRTTGLEGWSRASLERAGITCNGSV